MAAGVGVLGYHWFFPPDAVVIDRRVRGLVRLLRVETDQSIFAQAVRADRIADHFTHDVSLNLDGISKGSYNVSGRPELRQTALAARNRIVGMRCDVPSLKISINEETRTAEVDITLLIWHKEDPNPMVEDLCLSLRKEEGIWLIAAIEGVAEKSLPLETR